MRNLVQFQSLSRSTKWMSHSKSLVSHCLQGGLVSCGWGAALLAAPASAESKKVAPTKFNAPAPNSSSAAAQGAAKAPKGAEDLASSGARNGGALASQGGQQQGTPALKLFPSKKLGSSSDESLSSSPLNTSRPRFQSSIEGQLGAGILTQASNYVRPMLQLQGWTPFYQTSSAVAYGSAQLLPGFNLNPNKSGFSGNFAPLFKNWAFGVGARKFDAVQSSFYGGHLGLLLSGNSPIGGLAMGGRLAGEYGFSHYKCTALGAFGFKKAQDDNGNLYSMANNFGVSFQGLFRGFSFDLNSGSYLGSNIITPAAIGQGMLSYPFWLRLQLMALPISFFKVKVNFGSENLFVQTPKDLLGDEISDYGFSQTLVGGFDIDFLTHANVAGLNTTAKTSNPIDFNNLVASYAEQAPGIAYNRQMNSEFALTSSTLELKENETTKLRVCQSDVKSSESYKLKISSFQPLTVTETSNASSSTDGDSKRKKAQQSFSMGRANSVNNLDLKVDSEKIDSVVSIAVKSADSLKACGLLPAAKVLLEKTTQDGSDKTVEKIGEMPIYFGHYEGDGAIESGEYKISAWSESRKKGVTPLSGPTTYTNQALLGAHAPILNSPIKIELANSDKGKLPTKDNVVTFHLEPSSWDEKANGNFSQVAQFWIEPGESSGQYWLVLADASADTMNASLKEALLNADYKLSYTPDNWSLSGIKFKDVADSGGNGDDNQQPPVSDSKVQSVSLPTGITEGDATAGFKVATFAQGSTFKVKGDKGTESNPIKVEARHLNAFAGNGHSAGLQATFGANEPIAFSIVPAANPLVFGRVEKAVGGSLKDNLVVPNVFTDTVTGATGSNAGVLKDAALPTADQLKQLMTSYNIPVTNGTPVADLQKVADMIGFSVADVTPLSGKLTAYCKHPTDNNKVSAFDLTGSKTAPIEVDLTTAEGGGLIYLVAKLS